VSKRRYELFVILKQIRKFGSDFGSHRNELKVPYLTVASALGITREEIDKFFDIFGKCWHQLSQNKNESKTKTLPKATD